MTGGNRRIGAVVIMTGGNPDFGKTASDYAKHRQGFPEEFFKRLFNNGLLTANTRALDVGTGTGTIARGLARYCREIYACDPAAPILEKAKELSLQEGLQIQYVVGSAESTGMQDGSFDLLVAGQAWHWFDHPKAIAEVVRVLKPEGKLVIAHFDWLPLKGSVAALSEALVVKHNARWKGANGTGFYPEWAMQLAEAGFSNIETWSFDKTLTYTKESWIGRIRASAGVSGSLNPDQVAAFDSEHAALLDENFQGTELAIEHRCFTLVAHTPH